MTNEAFARVTIDALLAAQGWDKRVGKAGDAQGYIFPPLAEKQKQMAGKLKAEAAAVR